MTNEDSRFSKFQPFGESAADRLLDGLPDSQHEDSQHERLSSVLADASRVEADENAELFERVVSEMRPRSRRVTKHVAAIGIAAVATFSMGGAAAAGNLPSPIQSVASVSAAHVGIDLPDGERLSKTPAVTPPLIIPATTDASTTPVLPHTSIPLAPSPERPGPSSCEAARADDSAHGCSEVAKQHAPGQQQKSPTSTTSTTPHKNDKKSPTENESDSPGKSGSSQGKSNDESETKGKSESADKGNSNEKGKSQNDK